MTINRPKKININFPQVVNDDYTVVEVVTRKRKGRPILAESALKFDKLQQIEINKPVAKRVYIFYIMWTSQMNETSKKKI
jgi:hypothetical protein